ncbi:MAG: Crp/Fnr family transcriptional regulator [Rubrivivax sp.]|nr:Crp/Fnr family transcriptional regulator [Rubrivivax sp.]
MRGFAPAQVPPPDLLDTLLALPGAPMEAGSPAARPPLRQRVAAGTTLLHEGAPARQICIVHAGTFKSVKTGEDGYEQVLGFSLRGDVLGFDGLAGGRYASAAVALEDSAVFVFTPPELDALRRTCPPLDHALQAALSSQLAHAIELAALMSAVAAEARLARFVLQFAARLAAQGQSSRRLRLRMNRREIASHLGVAHETVSRSFSLLAQRGALRVDNREIEVLDPERLRALAHCTRGPLEEAPRAAAAPAALTPPSRYGSRSRWRVAA